jgi:RNA polymerase sigma factor (sigma-70 family)
MTHSGSDPTMNSSEEEFETLVSRHYEALYRFGYSLSGREADSRDLVQQTFLRWAQHGHQLRDRDKAKTWLFTTLYREFLGSQRRHQRFPHLDLDSAELELPTIEPETVAQMDGATVLQALQSLEENYRAPLSLFYLQQHSYQEIAAILEIPIGTVMSRLSRAKDQLRKALVHIDDRQQPSNIVSFPQSKPQPQSKIRHD